MYSYVNQSFKHLIVFFILFFYFVKILFLVISFRPPIIKKINFRLGIFGFFGMFPIYEFDYFLFLFDKIFQQLKTSVKNYIIFITPSVRQTFNF